MEMIIDRLPLDENEDNPSEYRPDQFLASFNASEKEALYNYLMALGFTTSKRVMQDALRKRAIHRSEFGIAAIVAAVANVLAWELRRPGLDGKSARQPGASRAVIQGW